MNLQEAALSTIIFLRAIWAPCESWSASSKIITFSEFEERASENLAREDFTMSMEPSTEQGWNHVSAPDRLRQQLRKGSLPGSRRSEKARGSLCYRTRTAASSFDFVASERIKSSKFFGAYSVVQREGLFAAIGLTD